MKTAEEWALECWTVTNIEVARSRMASAITDAQRESAEEMRQTLVDLVGDRLEASAQLVKDMLAVPLPGEMEAEVGQG